MEIGSRIGFYGAGRVGCTLARYFLDHGLNVTGFYNRTVERAKEAAEWTDTLCYETPGELLSENDVLFLTVSDQAVPAVAAELSAAGSLEGKLLCHTSGALSSHVFAGTGAYGYSIHPLYAIASKSESYQTLDRAFFTVEGDPLYLDAWVRTLKGIGLRTKAISAEEKVRYHASAVMASNLVCGLYAAAVEELSACGFTGREATEALSGLFLDNAAGLAAKGPEVQLTGPLERGDTETVSRHLAVLSGTERDTYLQLSRQVLKVARQKNPARDYSEMERILYGFGEEE